MKDLTFKLFPFAALLAFLVKCTVITPTLPDSIIFCSLVAYILVDGLRLSLKQLREMHETIQRMQEQLNKTETDVKNVQHNVSSVKLGMGIKQLHQSNSPKNG